eukprot:1972383-Alexandrium_andersonii.AAC.1
MLVLPAAHLGPREDVLHGHHVQALPGGHGRAGEWASQPWNGPCMAFGQAAMGDHREAASLAHRAFEDARKALG